MKAIILKQAGSVDELQIVELPLPIIGPDEVLVQTKAISINPVDAAVRSNAEFQKFVLGPVPAGDPIILGWDISGIVTETGNKVTKFKKGDEVFGMVNFIGHGKAYAQYVAAPESDLAMKPSAISHEQAAAATLTALTAWGALVTFGEIKPGDKVLIHSAAGGVGHQAVQIAKSFGAHVIGTGSAENKDFILGLGANEFIDYKTQNFEEVITDADLVVDGVSFTTEHLHRSIKSLKSGGRLISLVAFFDDEVNSALKEKNVFGHRFSVESNGEQMAVIAKLLGDNKLKSNIAKSFPFTEIKAAHLLVESGKTRGKLILDPIL
jgi:NADPH:quinone reductase-like Zn-dependent oxidoreductase